MQKAFYCKCGAVILVENNNQHEEITCQKCGEEIKGSTDGVSKNTIIGERYQVLDFFEEGAVSNLYFALDLRSNELVIIRVYCRDYSCSVKDPESFLHMAESMSLLAQPVHVKIIDYGIDDGYIYTVWPGGSVGSIQRLIQTHESFEPEVTISICREVAKCLAQSFENAGVSHYDLNPRNIFVNSQGEVKLAGLGFAVQLFRNNNFQEAEVTYYDWRYQSPEIVFNRQPADIRSDMFSLGLCLYTMITGQPAFSQTMPMGISDYERIGFSKADEYRLGDNFMELFSSLTNPDPDKRFSSWRDVITLMNRYLNEEKMVKNNIMSSQRRALTTSYDPEYFKNVDELSPLQDIKPRKRKPRTESAENIRKDQNPHATSAPKKVKGAVIRSGGASRDHAEKNPSRAGAGQSKGRKKKQSSTLPAVLVTVAVLLAAILVVFFVASDSRGQESAQVVASTDTSQKRDSSSLSGKRKSKEVLASKIGVISIEIPHNKLEKLSPEDQFNELTFEIRDLVLRKKWDEALAICDNYSGPYKKMIQVLRKEIVTKNKMDSLGNKVVSIEASKPIDEKPAAEIELGPIGSFILEGEVEKALKMLPRIEKKSKKDLFQIRELLESATESKLDELILANFQKEVDKEVSLKIDGNNYKGILGGVDVEGKMLQLTIALDKFRKIERSFELSKLSLKDKIIRLKKSDEDEVAFFHYVYLMKNKQVAEAEQTLLKYKGLLHRELIAEFNKEKREKTLLNWEALLSSFGLKNEEQEKVFIEKLSQLKISMADAWFLNHRLTVFGALNKETPEYEKIVVRVKLIKEFLAKLTKDIRPPAFIVSSNGEEGTVSLSEALKSARNGETVRILPGEYSGEYTVRKKIKLLGTRNVFFTKNVTLGASGVQFKNAIFSEGDIILTERVRDVKVHNVMLRSGIISMNGNNSFINIENCLMMGLSVNTNRKLSIEDCVILCKDTCRTSINGFVSGEISNSIIRSKHRFAFSFRKRLDNNLVIKDCLVYGKLGLLVMENGRRKVNSLDGFKRNGGRVIRSRMTEPSFINEREFNYKLKDFSPGFFDGEAGRCIGLRYNYNR